MKFRLVVVALVAVAVGAAGGCPKGGPKLVKVSGTVKFKDGTLILVKAKGEGKAPTITFNAVEPAPGQQRKGAGGPIDENGHFELMTFRPGDGVIPGKYIVTIRAFPDYPPKPGTSLVPEKYMDQKTSGLEFTIDGPKTDMVIELENKK